MDVPLTHFFVPRIQEVAECLNGRFRWSFDAKSILDLTAPSTRAHFGLKDSDFTRSYFARSGDLIPLQRIGRAVSQQRKITAIRYPSRTMQKRKKTGYNLALFQDLVNGSDFLEIVEGKKIGEKWPNENGLRSPS